MKMESTKVFEVIKVCTDLDRSELEKVIQMLVTMAGAKAYEYGYQQHESEILALTAQSKIQQLKERVDGIVGGKDEVE